VTPGGKLSVSVGVGDMVSVGTEGWMVGSGVDVTGKIGGVIVGGTMTIGVKVGGGGGGKVFVGICVGGR